MLRPDRDVISKTDVLRLVNKGNWLLWIVAPVGCRPNSLVLLMIEAAEAEKYALYITSLTQLCRAAVSSTSIAMLTERLEALSLVDSSVPDEVLLAYSRDKLREQSLTRYCCFTPTDCMDLLYRLQNALYTEYPILCDPRKGHLQECRRNVTAFQICDNGVVHFNDIEVVVETEPFIPWDPHRLILCTRIDREQFEYPANCIVDYNWETVCSKVNEVYAR